MASNEITTILGKGSSFDGKLTFEGAVRIDGVFSGEIETKGTLMIGETAEVKAKIHASQIIIEGLIRGEIIATNSLEIHDSARVYGNLLCPSLMIQKGAIFEGTCQMESAAAGAAADGAMSGRAMPLADSDSDSDADSDSEA